MKYKRRFQLNEDSIRCRCDRERSWRSVGRRLWPTAPLPAFKAFEGSRSGVAAVEFAMLAPLMLVVVSGLANLGFILQSKIQINTALSSAGYYAFEAGQNLSSSNADDFADKIESLVAAQLTGRGTFSTSVLFNGSEEKSAMDDYYCVSDTSPATFSRSGSTQSSCQQNLMSGKYVTIEVTGQIEAPAPFASFMGSVINVAETTHVRVR